MSVIEIRNLSKIYKQGERTRHVLESVNLDVHGGEFFVILGKSGSGKSTLLNLISAIDKTDGGQIFVQGTEITSLREREQTLFRREHIGIVFQSFNLIPTLSVVENITLPLDLQGAPSQQSRAKALDLLEQVGLKNRADTFPDRLSGGEQQRVAIARALVHEPALVLADEPTGNLDEGTGEQVLQLLLSLTRDAGKTLLMATHDPTIVPLADRICRIHDGQLLISEAKEADIDALLIEAM